MSRSARWVGCVVALTLGCASLGLGALACSHSHDPSPGVVAADLADVAYEEPANDEALLELVTAKVQTKGSVAIVAPAAGAQLSQAAVAVFAWSEMRFVRIELPQRLGQPQQGETREEWARAQPSPSLMPRAGAKRVQGASFSQQLRELLALEGVAHAHGTPTNGQAYFLSVGVAGSTPALRVFTTKKQYEPTADQWVKLKALKGTIQVSLRAGQFEDSRLLAGGGPIEAAPVTFTWKP